MVEEALSPIADLAILDCPDAIVAVNNLARITLWNPAAEQMFGYPASTAIGNSLTLIIPDAARAAHVAGFHRAMDSGELDTRNAPVLVRPTHADGHTLVAHMRISLLVAPNGQRVGAMATFRPTDSPRPITDFIPENQRTSG